MQTQRHEVTMDNYYTLQIDSKLLKEDCIHIKTEDDLVIRIKRTRDGRYNASLAINVVDQDTGNNISSLKVEIPKPSGLDRVNSTLKVEGALLDAARASGTPTTGYSFEFGDYVVAVGVEGCKDYYDTGHTIILEAYNGNPALMVWNDVTSEDYTHKIDLR